MNTSELALVVFTIAAQMSVGAFIVLGVVHFFAARRFGMPCADRMSDYALLAIGPVMVLGLIFSFFHLGNPINAPRAIMNLGSSWLSREILFGLLFAGVGFVFAIMQWRKLGSPLLRNILAWVAAVVGILLVYSMSMVYYSLDAVPAWSSWATPASFFTTTVLLGALAVGVAFIGVYTWLRKNATAEIEQQREVLSASLRWVTVAAVVALGLHFVIIPLYMAYLAVSGPVAEKSASIIMEENGVWFALRLVLLFIGAGLFSLFINQLALQKKNFVLLSTLAWSAFVLVLAGEVIGRFLFYLSYARVGLM